MPTEQELRQEQDIKLIQQMEAIKLTLDSRKLDSPNYDGRALSIAITHLETAMLWFATARKETTI